MPVKEQTDLWNKALEVIPTGCQTLSKCPNRYVEGVYPKMLRGGDGSMVEDTEGRFYTDFIAGLGAILLGYRNPRVDNAVMDSIVGGEVLLSLPHQKETELAEALKANFSYAEMSRFFKTGSDALSAAVRVARAHTGKEKVLVCGYHGWHDWYCASGDKTAGVPKAMSFLVSKFPYNDLQALEDLLRNGDVAAIVMEPVVYEEPKDGYLSKLVVLAHQYGAVVVFDEVVTGLRFGLGGAQRHFGASPDLSCLSKALGNGYPIAALVGRSELMRTFERDDFFVSGTYGGDLIGITAAIATIDACRDGAVEVIWERGERLKGGFNQIARELGLEKVRCIGYAPRTYFDFPTRAHKALFWQESVKRGRLIGYANFVMTAHRALDIESSLNDFEDCLKIVKGAWSNPEAELEGKMPVEVFRMVK